MSLLTAPPRIHIAGRIRQRMRDTDGFRRLERGVRSGSGTYWLRGLHGSAAASTIAALLAGEGEDAPGTTADVLMVVPDAAAAEDLRDDLSFLLGAGSAVLFPDPGIEPYGRQHAKVPARAARIEALAALANRAHRPALSACYNLRVVVATANALVCPVPSPAQMRKSVQPLRVGDTVDLDELMRRLVAIGFSTVPQVGEYGDMSRRGGILDVYTFGRENPVRIEFDGDELVSMREFDSFSQRSVKNLSEVVVLPLFEWLADRETTNQVLENPPAGIQAETLLAVLESMESDGTLEGIEWSLPHLGVARARLAEYFEGSPLALVLRPTFVRACQHDFTEGLAHHYSQLLRADDEQASAVPPAPPEELFWLDDPWPAALGAPVRVFIGSGGSVAEVPNPMLAAPPDPGAPPAAPAPPAPEESPDSSLAEFTAIEFRTLAPTRFERNLEQTREYVRELARDLPEIHILCDTENHRDRLSDVLKRVPADFHVGNLAAGFLCPEAGFAVLTDHEIFARIRRRSTPRRFSRGLSIKDLLALVPGDFVVHVEHGIGLYKGLSRLVMSGQETDCLTLEYSGGDLHYVPVDQLGVVQKYSAEEGVRPSLSRLGGKQWSQTKARIKKSIKDMAAELIKLYAVRKARPGHAFSADTELQMQLEASFPYDETPDQLRAIEDVKRDMESPSPMDRLICGDVGYGKTEVAIRAAFKTVQDGKQAAVLVPTTLLAQQHFETFRDRLKDLPVTVDYLCRFRSAKESKEVVQRLREGKVDVVIGTHMLLAKAVEFKDLGLVIVDEEQLFGVAHKERLKKYRDSVDVLTLTATPIPRTMHLALMGGRDMSTILTPPVDRRPIQTEIVEFRDDVIAHALMREADRGGQSFFVHNRVETIDRMANYIAKMVPHLRVAVGHGQMSERALEDVMHRFLHREYDVLVSTMIIESGLDLPNVNTIVIDRGDMFGLSQLYQLRGRVGRSARRAYAYLLVPSQLVLTENAQKRLKAMEEFEDLGSGYQLALRDLEIRGAGNLLGAEQHGFIVNVGFELYCQLLDEAVRELKGQAPDLVVDPRMSTDLEAYLPEEYVPDPREKINVYKSLADAKSLERVEEISGEMADRFGKHPEPVRNLIGLRRVRILAGALGVEKISVHKNLVSMEMGRELKKGEIQRFLTGLPFQVEFVLHGRHRIQTRPGSAGPLSTALVMLRTLEQAAKP